MNKSQAKKKVFDYFKKNAIEYKFVNEELKLIDVDSLDTIYLCASIPEVIGGHIETCIRFREEHLYCHCKKSLWWLEYNRVLRESRNHPQLF